MIISVPYDSLQSPPFPAGLGLAPVYSMPAGTATPATPGLGSCGTYCVDVQVRPHADDTLQFGVGSMIQMNVDSERRFLNVTAKRNMGAGRYQITFSAGDTLFLHPADLGARSPAREPSAAAGRDIVPEDHPGDVLPERTEADHAQHPPDDAVARRSAKSSPTA